MSASPPHAQRIEQERLAAIIAHELRTPLTAMANALRLCSRDVDPQVFATVRETFGRQLSKALRLLDDLAGATRFSGGLYTMQTTRLDLVEVIHEAVSESSHAFRARGQVLTVDLPTAAVWVRGDALRLEQVVVNLLNNSSKFTPHEGHIEVHLACERGEAILRVRDDGLGVLPDDLPHIFELFYHGRPCTDSADPGMGIGLALARKLVRLHGGTIVACSDGANRGAEFAVRLPVAPR